MGPAKSKDFGTALSSVVVTAGEFLPALDALTTEVRVNGELWGAGSTRNMRHPVADVIAYASAGEQLAAGTVIGLGTVPGCSGIEVGRWLSPGDTVETLEQDRSAGCGIRWASPSRGGRRKR